MGIRQDQWMGLSVAAQAFIFAKTQKDHIVNIRFVNGILENVDCNEVPKKIENDKLEKYKVFGMYENEYKTNAYLLKDGTKVYEKLQENPWSSGPMFFLALVDENDEWLESTKWDEKVIEKESSCGPIE